MALEPTLPLVFGAGLISAASPCILPILPPLLAGSVGKWHRPLLLVAGLTLSFSAFGGLVAGAGLGGALQDLRWLFLLLIVLLGLAMALPVLKERWSRAMGRLVSRLPAAAAARRSGSPLGALALGALLGLVWVPCIGLILGAVLTVAANTGDAAYGAGMLALYSLGAGTPILLIAYGSKAAASRLQRLREWGPAIERTAGWVMVAAGVAMFLNLDRALQAALVPFLQEMESGLLLGR
jgi:cytochrome c biogenesis protein CcdA